LSRPLIIIALAASLFTQAAYAQEGKKCPAVHHGPIGIFVEPTHEEREAMRKEHSAEELSTIFDDSMWYDYQASLFLEKRGIPVCSTTEERHEFVTADGKKYSIDEECRYWCLVLWNGRDEPVSIYSIDIDMYEDYLKGK
jgi:hypothetical protein